ncbi:hypothetical protein SAMN05216464_111228 [Mucilaginibacter pineti]|uniref:Uncharacterized protein n=1 Tax=Mucilaginibacter pineti TaxID=1391627 RepID=A0A1G7HHD1_9SPHI|nr:hypothetical protein [Mucilaginibacter pineti]SDE99798.1 hypothetical protein SAMN05216464_111228 [Mucilaginibacter pineti]
MYRIITLLFLSLITVSCSAQSLCDKLAQLKQECYGFKPEGLTDEQREAKSAALDRFWNLAMSDTLQAAPCLKEMILAEKNDSYFCFDASSLLLKMDNRHQYTDVALAGVQKSNIDDLQLEPYLQMCFYLGHMGKDVGSLAEKLISKPQASVYLTIHVVTLSAIDASLFLYNTMSTEKAEGYLIKAVTQGNATARHNGAVALNIIATTKGDSLLNSLIASKQLADSTITFILNDRKTFTQNASCKGNISREEILGDLQRSRTDSRINYFGFAGNDETICAACTQLRKEDIDAIRTARMKATPGLSDEGLSEYFALTKILMTVRSKSAVK